MSTNPATWMTDNYDALKDKPFSQITLLGSHDSGMSTTTSAGAGSIEGSQGITQAQSLSVRDQIVGAGVRYLDLRPVWSGTRAQYYTAHYSKVDTTVLGAPAYVGWLGETLDDVVQDILLAYAGDPDDPTAPVMGSSDVLLIELSHGADLGDVEASSLEYGQLADIAAAFTTKLGDFLYQNSSSPSFWDLTPSDFVDNRRIFLSAGANTATPSSHGPVFPHAQAFYYDDNGSGHDNYRDVINGLTALMSKAAAEQPGMPLLLPFHCTGNAGNEAVTLHDMAIDLNPLFMDSLAAWATSKGVISFTPSERRVPTIVTADYVSRDDLRLLDACIGMNVGEYYGITSQSQSTEACQQGPAVASLGGSTYAAWTGTDNHLNVQAPAGTGTVVTSKNQGSTQSPALCSSGNELVIAWTGTDKHVNVAQVDAETLAIVAVTTTSQSAFHGPALAFLNGVLYLAWTGTDNHLNVMWSTDGGHSFPSGNKHSIPTQSSADTPALCVLDGGLQLVWKGTDNQLNVIPLVVSGTAVTGTGPLSQPGQVSEHGPAAVVVDNTMVISYVGTGHNMVNVVMSRDGHTFTSPYVSVNASNATPALCAGGPGAVLAWAGTDDQHTLNTAQFILASTGV